ncbi:hypothetical protein [Spirosoma lituiforme]
MCAIIRYIYPMVDPWSLAIEDLIRIWREADYVIKTFRLINKDEK